MIWKNTCKSSLCSPTPNSYEDTGSYPRIKKCFINLINRYKQGSWITLKRSYRHFQLSAILFSSYSVGKLYMLKDYKINPNEFKIISNLIYLGLDLMLFPLFYSLPAIKSSLVPMQHHLVRTLKTNKTLCKINCRNITKKCMCMHVQIPLCKSERKLLYRDGGKMV